MDMYEKRKQRQNKKEEKGNNEENQSKININWDNPTKGQLSSNPYN